MDYFFPKSKENIQKDNTFLLNHPQKKYIHHKKHAFKRNVTQKKQSASKKGPIIALIYADWCGHCRHLKPIWHKMKNKIKHHPFFKEGTIVEIEDSDPAKDHKMKQIDHSIQVNGFPTIIKKRNPNQSVEYYNGNRNENDLIQWIIGHKTGGYHSNSSLSARHTKTKKSQKNKKRSSSLLSW